MLYNMLDLTALELRGYGGKINLERVLDNGGTELDGGGWGRVQTCPLNDRSHSRSSWGKQCFWRFVSAIVTVYLLQTTL